MFANVQVAVFILFTVAFSLLVIRKSNFGNWNAEYSGKSLPN